MKKVRKLVKICMCLMMILSYVFTCFAASADGSAFITKEEFDIALVEFNRKLSTFEAGINSKIDSQVTSYLDRNGIWSEMPQTINAASSAKTVTPPTVVVASNKAAGSYIWDGPWRYIEKVNKSGLLFGSYLYRNNTSTNSNNTRWGWSGNMQTNANWRSDNGFVCIISVYEKKKSTTSLDKKYSATLFSAIGANSSNEADATGFALVASLPAVGVETPFQIFVSKDSEILWELQTIYHFACITGASPQTAADSVLYVNMKSASVY